MVCQLWPLVASLGLNNPPGTCKVPNKKYTAGTGFHSIVAKCAQMCTADCHKENNITTDCHKENNHMADCHDENNHTADCHCQESKFESGLFMLWQIAVLERSLPHKTEVTYQPFYIDSPPVRGAVAFLCATLLV
jgi:hypothetical protein